MNRLMTAFAATFLLIAGCGSGPEGTDEGADALTNDLATDAVEDSLETPDSVDTVQPDAILPDIADDTTAPDVQGPDSAADLIPFEDGATAYIIRSADELMTGPVAAGAVGDIMIRNKDVRFIVRTQEIGLYSPFGGNLVDADLVREPGDEGHEKFMELFPMIGFGRAMKPESIEIIDDGTYSGEAVVRVTGFDHGLSIIDMLMPTLPFSLGAIMDYVLKPDAREIEVRLTVTNNASYQQEVSVGSVVQLGKRFEKFYHVCGLTKACLTGRSDVEWLAGGADDVSIGFTAPEGTNPRVVLAEEDLLLTELAAPTLKPGESVSVKFFLIVGDGTIDSVATRAWELRNRQGLRTVTGKISLSETVTNMADVRVHARKSGSTGNTGWVDSGRPDDDGNVLLHLPDGLHDLTVTAPGSDDVTLAISVAENDVNTFEADTNPAGALHVTVRDGEGNLLPAGMLLKSGLSAPTESNGQFMTVVGGDVTYPVKPGEYTVMAVKGFEYDVMSSNATVLPGETTHLMLTLNRVIDTPNQVTLVAHAHGEDSIDSFVTREQRVHNALAAGIEFAMVTDHDRFTSIQPEIDAAGMSELLKSTVGTEISPLGFHTVAMNCKNPPTYPTYFSIRFGDYDENGYLTTQYPPNQLFDLARDTFQCQYVGVAHPWEGSAMFKYIGMTGADDPADFVDTFDASRINGIELINSNDSMVQLDSVQLADWFNFINRGYRVHAVGGSDEHGFSMNYGYPLNLVQATTDVPGDLNPDEVFAAFASGRTMLYAGPYIEVDINGMTIGDTVDLSADLETAELVATVRWPGWMHVEFIRIYANGMLLEKSDLPELEESPAPNEAILRWPLQDLTADTHFVIVAGSLATAHDMPGYGRPPISVTNPIYVDVDGDGWEPPVF